MTTENKKTDTYSGVVKVLLIDPLDCKTRSLALTLGGVDTRTLRLTRPWYRLTGLGMVTKKEVLDLQAATLRGFVHFKCTKHRFLIIDDPRLIPAGAYLLVVRPSVPDLTNALVASTTISNHNKELMTMEALRRCECLNSQAMGRGALCLTAEFVTPEVLRGHFHLKNSLSFWEKVFGCTTSRKLLTAASGAAALFLTLGLLFTGGCAGLPSTGTQPIQAVGYYTNSVGQVTPLFILPPDAPMDKTDVREQVARAADTAATVNSYIPSPFQGIIGAALVALGALLRSPLARGVSKLSSKKQDTQPKS